MLFRSEVKKWIYAETFWLIDNKKLSKYLRDILVSMATARKRVLNIAIFTSGCVCCILVFKLVVLVLADQ